MKRINFTELFIFIIGTELVGAISGVLSGGFSEFYNTLVKPPFSPPGWIFPVVWSILYALMGVSAYLIYSSDARDNQKKTALTVYGLQLFFNFIWSILFFRFELLSFAVVDAVILLLMIIYMIYKFRKISPRAAVLNIPYLLWIIFATYLSIGFLVLN